MRLGIKNVLLLLVGYALLMTAFALGIDRTLHAFEDAVVLETSRLIAQEKADLISDRSLGALQMPDAKSRELLRQRILDLTLLSEVAGSITVVDREGRVAASDRATTGHQTLRADAIFGDRWEVRPRPGSAARFLRGGEYVLDVPLVERNQLVGYIEVEFQSRRIAGLFSSARRQLLIAALGGLAGVLVLGAALQLQVSRQAAAITRTLEDAMQGAADPTPSARPQDELARALRAATGVRTALHKARRETDRLHEGLAALARATQTGVVLLRGEREPEFANARCLELFGASSLEDLRSRWHGARERLEPLLNPLGPGGAEAAQAVEIEIPAGGVPTLRVEAYRLGADDEYLLLLNDAEVLDSLEGDVRLASQLQGLARAYRTMAHEIRAPLSAMMIHLDLLRESLATGSPELRNESQERYVVVLRDELQRLNRSLSEILTGALPPGDKRDKFDLRDALAEVGTLLAPQSRRQGVRLRSERLETPVMLVGYRDRLKQSFLNIAVNALEAMPGGGSLSFEMEMDRADVKVRISDTGRGIPKDDLARIYERDFTTKASGSGIGLFVARTLVELHGGEIRVDSEEGRGTHVEVRLPVLPRD